MSTVSVGELRAAGRSRTGRSELARRVSNGVEVALFWRKSTNQVTVEVVDNCLGESFALEVDGSDALHAFHHPYAYAASRPY